MPDLRDLWLRVWSDRPRALEEIEGDQASGDPARQRRLWLESEGFAVADPILGAEGAWSLEVGVVPEARGQGVGRRLYAQATAGIEGLTFVRVAEDDAASLAFAERRGFKRRKLDFESTLDPQAVDSALLETWATTETEIVPMDEMDSEAYRRAFHAFFEAVRPDIPRATPPKPLTFEEFESYVLSEFCWEGSFVALEGGEIVGFTGTYPGAEPGVLDQWLLAVRRDRRGRGLARAMKARGVLCARANGVREIRTDNDSRNAPMLSINERVGFVRKAGLWSLAKVLHRASPESL